MWSSSMITQPEKENQIMAKFEAWLLGVGKFKSSGDGCPEKGHSHCKLDQRFSTNSTALARSHVLEDKDDVQSRMEEFLHPVKIVKY